MKKSKSYLNEDLFIFVHFSEMKASRPVEIDILVSMLENIRFIHAFLYRMKLQ